MFVRTQSDQCRLPFETDYCSQTYQRYDVHFSRSREVIHRVTIRIVICHFLISGGVV